MRLYFSPGACSLSDRIALYEADLAFDSELVDLGTKRTESGADYLRINPKGYVPALVLDTGETLTENVAILDWIAQQDSKLKPLTPMGRTRLLEALAYISSEIHANRPSSATWGTPSWRTGMVLPDPSLRAPPARSSEAALALLDRHRCSGPRVTLGADKAYGRLE